ncbi:PREDICTED: uncharacterized protein LOC109152981 [Ipomoea nil]|uniref:uncharacterized protein LOC109152981 n=1 Tax=Ipomoea nil TaxID=35883 RepID=UPI0009017BDF|nr:PREDICTED: uncharacterized protein LOC109152981 [Ipomoea nil]
MSPTTTTTEVKTAVERREILGPAGNRVREVEEQRKKKDGLMKPERAKKLGAETPKPGPVLGRSTGPVDRSASSCGGSTLKKLNSKGRVNGNVNKPAKVVPDGAVAAAMSPMAPVPLKRCDWITPNTEPHYACFHDEEWGVPVHDDAKLIELLVLSQALAELTWPVILDRREALRRLFNSFDPSYVANLDEKKLMIGNGNRLLSEAKLRAIVENAKQLLKIQSEFGSFSNYCWRFVNHQPLRGRFQYARQIPAKTPKSEFISKDLMRRGFCCVGPTVIYSFMQAAGLVNDHLVTCFRYNECSSNSVVKSKPMLEKAVARGETEEKTGTNSKAVIEHLK